MISLDFAPYAHALEPSAIPARRMVGFMETSYLSPSTHAARMATIRCLVFTEYLFREAIYGPVRTARYMANLLEELSTGNDHHLEVAFRVLDYEVGHIGPWVKPEMDHEMSRFAPGNDHHLEVAFRVLDYEVGHIGPWVKPVMDHEMSRFAPDLYK